MLRIRWHPRTIIPKFLNTLAYSKRHGFHFEQFWPFTLLCHIKNADGQTNKQIAFLVDVQYILYVYLLTESPCVDMSRALVIISSSSSTSHLCLTFCSTLRALSTLLWNTSHRGVSGVYKRLMNIKIPGIKPNPSIHL